MAHLLLWSRAVIEDGGKRLLSSYQGSYYCLLLPPERASTQFAHFVKLFASKPPSGWLWWKLTNERTLLLDLADCDFRFFATD